MTDYEHGKLYVYDATTQTFDPYYPPVCDDQLFICIAEKCPLYGKEVKTKA